MELADVSNNEVIISCVLGGLGIVAVTAIVVWLIVGTWNS